MAEYRAPALLACALGLGTCVGVDFCTSAISTNFGVFQAISLAPFAVNARLTPAGGHVSVFRVVHPPLLKGRLVRLAEIVDISVDIEDVVGRNVLRERWHAAIRFAAHQHIIHLIVADAARAGRRQVGRPAAAGAVVAVALVAIQFQERPAAIAQRAQVSCHRQIRQAGPGPAGCLHDFEMCW